MAESIDHKATDWLLRLNESDATAQDFDAFNEWCARDRLHREAYERVASLWADLGEMHPVIAGTAANNVTPVLSSGTGQQRPGLLKRFRGTAAWSGAIAACITFFIAVSSGEVASFLADHSTATGEQTRVTLEDGTIAYLNTNTAMNVSFDADGRRIDLLRGEAFFEVSRDPERPFTVVAYEGHSVAIGTAYGVRSDFASGQTAVTVQEGVVGVRPGGAKDTQSVVRAGQQVRYSAETGMGPVTDVDIEDSLSWKRGLVSFDGLQMSEAIAEIDRYMPGMILLLDVEVRSEAVTATLAIRSLDDGLRALAATQNLSVHKVSPYLTLLY